jgi:hypothetical protein
VNLPAANQAVRQAGCSKRDCWRSTAQTIRANLAASATTTTLGCDRASRLTTLPFSFAWRLGGAWRRASTHDDWYKIALFYGATIDKYVGDAIVILFGDPETRGVKEDALACVEMAIAMRNRMRDLHDVWRASGIEKPPPVPDRNQHKLSNSCLKTAVAFWTAPRTPRQVDATWVPPTAQCVCFGNEQGSETTISIWLACFGNSAEAENGFLIQAQFNFQEKRSTGPEFDLPPTRAICLEADFSGVIFTNRIPIIGSLLRRLQISVRPQPLNQNPINHR